jgi:predicted O-methyltransferase YrrM
MMKYEIYQSPLDGGQTLKRENEDGSISFIPMDEANSDYQAYLEHEATSK